MVSSICKLVNCIYNACVLVCFIQLHVVVSQLVLEIVVTILELLAGCSVAPVISGITVCVGAAYSDVKRDDFVLICSKC